MDDKATAIQAWRRCIEIFGRGYPTDEDEVLPIFKQALSAAVRHGQAHPDDPELRALQGHWSRTLEGVDDVEADSTAVVQCLCGSYALGKAQESTRVWRQLQRERGRSSPETLTRIIRLLEEQAIPAFEHVLRFRPGHAYAQSQLREAEELKMYLEAQEVASRRRWWKFWR